MSQNDFVIANQTTPAFRTDLNNALQALASMSSGATEPSTTYANMAWYDTTNNILKMRNEANDAWINLFDLDQSADTAAAYVSAILQSIEANSFAAGDVLYHNGAGLVRLPKGTAGQYLVMNSGATAPEWGGGGLNPGSPVNQAAWHPYNSLEIGDGNDGVIWDQSVDGRVSTLDTPEFEDGYEYMLFIKDIEPGGGSFSALRATVQRSTDDGWFSEQDITATVTNALSGYLWVPYARSSRLVHGVSPFLAYNNTTLVNESFDNGSTPYKVKALRISAKTNDFQTGKVALLRRRVEFEE